MNHCIVVERKVSELPVAAYVWLNDLLTALTAAAWQWCHVGPLGAAWRQTLLQDSSIICSHYFLSQARLANLVAKLYVVRINVAA